MVCLLYIFLVYLFQWTEIKENLCEKMDFRALKKFFILSTRERLNELNTNTDNTRKKKKKKKKKKEWISSRTRCNKKSGKASTL